MGFDWPAAAALSAHCIRFLLFPCALTLTPHAARIQGIYTLRHSAQCYPESYHIQVDKLFMRDTSALGSSDDIDPDCLSISVPHRSALRRCLAACFARLSIAVASETTREID